jgi:hypothetical protein
MAKSKEMSQEMLHAQVKTPDWLQDKSRDAMLAAEWVE